MVLETGSPNRRYGGYRSPGHEIVFVTVGGRDSAVTVTGYALQYGGVSTHVSSIENKSTNRRSSRTHGSYLGSSCEKQEAVEERLCASTEPVCCDELTIVPLLRWLRKGEGNLEELDVKCPSWYCCRSWFRKGQWAVPDVRGGGGIGQLEEIKQSRRPEGTERRQFRKLDGRKRRSR